MGASIVRVKHLRAGDLVVVRSQVEIRSTLDENGSLDGLPFMPEMLDWCGKPFRVSRRVEKTCVDVPDPRIYSNRRFANQDVVILDGPRCDGSAHDGCGRGCRVFWKEAWLRRVEGETALPSAVESGLAGLRSSLKVMSGADRYFCQSTELFKATEAFPGKKKPWMVWIALREAVTGELHARKVALLLLRWCRMLLRRTVTDDARLRGPNRRTPTAALDLQPGDLVRVKSRTQIEQTLDGRARNRGMGICEEMTRFCGREAEVRRRVERIIEERTGNMRALSHTVMLQNLRGNPTACEECLCAAELGDCPRGELMYWREIWLERATESLA